MQLSKFVPLEPPKFIKNIINDSLMMQRYRYLKIDKPAPQNMSLMSQPVISFNNFVREIKTDKHCSQILKTKLIKKVHADKLNEKMQRKAQSLLNLYLMFKLNEFMLQNVSKSIPIPFSVLDTRDEGDYLQDNQKKEYPHYSNVIKPTQYPPISRNKAYIPRPLPRKDNFSKDVEETIKFKIKQISRFPKLLIRLGNDEFSEISQQLLTSVSNVKLLYDFFNDYFDIEQKIGSRGDQNRKKYLSMVKKDIKLALKYFKQAYFESAYLPFQQRFMSLKDVRECLNKKRQEAGSENSSSS